MRCDNLDKEHNEIPNSQSTEILTDVAEDMIEGGKYGYRNLPDYICELLS